MTTADCYPRNLVGYGKTPPDPKWPGDARLAISFVLNVEEGGENTLLNGDAGSETYLHEIPGGQPLMGMRNTNVESMYDYGARAGFWRVLRLFEQRGLKFTAYAVARALELNPEAGKAMVEAGHEVASHGYRWIDYQYMAPELEREHIRKAVAITERVCGTRPLGIYVGRTSPNSRALIIEEGGFLYDSDAYDDDLPHWQVHGGKPHLVIPYTLDNNDMKYAVAPGFTAPDGFFQYLKDAVDMLRQEGETQPKMMSVGLHCRLVGRPGRALALARFLDYVAGLDDVWVARRVDIAKHWIEHHPYKP